MQAQRPQEKIVVKTIIFHQGEAGCPAVTASLLATNRLAGYQPRQKDSTASSLWMGPDCGDLIDNPFSVLRDHCRKTPINFPRNVCGIIHS